MIDLGNKEKYSKRVGSLCSDCSVLTASVLSDINQVFYGEGPDGDLSSTDLSVRYVTGQQYHDLVTGASGQFELKTLYVVSSDQINAYNTQIKNVGDPEEEKDAANKWYVDYACESVLTIAGESTDEDLRNYYKKSETSSSSEISIAFENALSADAVKIGNNSKASVDGATALGYNTNAAGKGSVAIGGGYFNGSTTYNSSAQALSDYSTAIGQGAIASAIDAVQIGRGTNLSSGTLQFKDYMIIDSNGNIPNDRLNADAELLSTSTNPIQNKVVKIALDEKRNIDDLSYTVGDWFVTGAAEMSLLSDQSVVAPNMQWIATIDTVEWVLSYNGAFWRFGTRAAYADDESSGPDSTKLTFNIDGNIYNLTKGARLALTTDIPPAQVNADWNATSGVAQILNKPMIPAAVEVDSTLTISSAAADAKTVGDALRSGFTPWEFGDGGTHMITGPFDGGGFWYYLLDNTYGDLNEFHTEAEALAATSLEFAESQTAIRCIVTPTKTSQLTNDGAPNGGGNAYVMTNDTRLTDARPPTAHHATHAANGSDPLAPVDIGAAAAADLRYRLMEPGKWEFSGSGYDPSNHTYSVNIEEIGDGYEYQLLIDGTVEDYAQGATDDLLSVSFYITGITATCASLPGHLLDRAVNTVNVSATTILTLPASQYEDKARNLYVNFSIQDGAQTVTFNNYDENGNEISLLNSSSSNFSMSQGHHVIHILEAVQSTFIVSELPLLQ